MATYSLSEIDALTRKATRGAGYSWGMAEEVGKATRWLSAFGFAGPEVLAQHLEEVTNSPQTNIPSLKKPKLQENIFEFENCNKPTCSLYCCMLINDLGHVVADNKTLKFINVMFPLLALPSVGRIAEAYDMTVAFSFEENTIVCSPNGIEIKNHSTASVGHTPPLFSDNSFLSSKTNQSDVICNRVYTEARVTHTPDPQGREISAEAIEILEKFAHKTYAPATEESRLRGAG